MIKLKNIHVRIVHFFCVIGTPLNRSIKSQNRVIVELLSLSRSLVELIGSIRVITDRGVNTDRWLTIHMSKNTGL